MAFEFETSLSTTVSHLFLLLLIHIYICLYILYCGWPTASIENVINNHFENVYSVMTLLWANNEIENNKYCA